IARLTAQALADFVLPNQARPSWAEGLELNVPDQMSCAGLCPLRLLQAKRPSSQRNAARRMDSPPTPDGSAPVPIRGPLAALPWPVKFRACNWRDEAHVSSPANPFKSTISPMLRVTHSLPVPMQ